MEDRNLKALRAAGEELQRKPPKQTFAATLKGRFDTAAHPGVRSSAASVPLVR
jgi:hypothetical protein